MTSLGRAALVATATAATVVVADRVSKAAVRNVPERQVIELPGNVTMRHIEHRAPTDSIRSRALIAGGALLGAGWLASGVALRRPGLIQVGAGLVAGGMASNLYDRSRRGSVTDMLPTPIGHVNLADVAIATGIGLFALGLVLRR